MVRFVWHRENVEHDARHGLSPQEVEAVFGANEAYVITAYPIGRRRRRT